MQASRSMMGFDTFGGRSMSDQVLRCAYCGEPLELNTQGVAAWRIGKEFVCNEYCADGIAPADPTVSHCSSSGERIA
jgi:hypothetical protein